VNVCVRVQNPAYFTGSDVRVRDPDLPKLNFAVAFKGASWTDADAIPLMVIQSIIGAWNKGGAGGGYTHFAHQCLCASAAPTSLLGNAYGASQCSTPLRPS